MSDPARFRQIVWPLAFGETLVWAAFYYAFPALLPTWEQALGWSKTELTGAFTLSLLVSALAAPFAGRLIDRGYARQVFAGGALLGVLMLLLLSQVSALWQFYGVWIGLGLAMASTLYEACFAILVLAMGPSARRAITLVTLVAGFAGTIAFPATYVLTALIGWRGTVAVFALVVLLLAVPLIWIGCRRAEGAGDSHAQVASARPGQALAVARSATFWLIAVAFAMIALDYSMIVTHVLPILDDRGVHPEVAVIAASMIGPMQVAGRLAMMVAERNVSTRVISLGCFIVLAVAAAALFGAGAVPGLVVGFIVLLGAGVGVESIIKPLVTADLLGRHDFGIVSGMIAVPSIGIAALAPIVAALLWDAGGYDLVILAALAAALIGLMALAAAFRAAAR
ncbi:MAG: MFS transporter [Pseudomonadota bacterium]